MDKILFYHGGPGLNSNPERRLLTVLYRKNGLALLAWDEPSVLRNTLNDGCDQTRFEQWLHSAEGFLLTHYDGVPLTLMGSSMGCQAVSWLTQRHPEKVKLAVLSAPCFLICQADRYIFNVMAKDYETYDEKDVAIKLRTVLNNFSDSFDDNTVAGLQLALSNPRLFDYYWVNKEKQQQFLSAFTAPGYTLDMDSYFGVRKSMTQLTFTPNDTAAIVCYGAHDVTTNVPAELETVKTIFPNAMRYKMDQSAHYPHIDEAENVVRIIKTHLNDF